MKSRVQPKYKTKYRVGNWPAYERGLVQRGDVTLWLSADARDAWRPSPSGQPGGQQRFSDLAISTTLTLRLVFRLPLRQAEGFVRSVLASMDVDLEAPDHTTLSRRSRYLAVGLHRVPVKGPIHLIVDSTGLSIAGEGEWATAKHGGRGQRGWKKLHLGVDGAGVIVAHTLTEATVDDATTGVGLIEALHADLARVTADAAYDTIAFYAAATARDAIVVVPPNKAARVSRRRPRSSARDRTIQKMKQIGRRRWKAEAGYYRHGPRGERRLPVQVDHRGSPSRPSSRRATSRGAHRVPHLESDDRPGKARLVRHRPMKGPWVGIVLGGVRFMHQRPLLTPCVRHRSGTGTPLSASRRMPTIWVSLNLDFCMTASWTRAVYVQLSIDRGSLRRHATQARRLVRLRLITNIIGPDAIRMGSGQRPAESTRRLPSLETPDGARKRPRRVNPRDNVSDGRPTAPHGPDGAVYEYVASAASPRERSTNWSVGQRLS